MEAKLIITLKRKKIELRGTNESVNELRNFIIANCEKIPAMAMQLDLQ